MNQGQIKVEQSPKAKTFTDLTSVQASAEPVESSDSVFTQKLQHFAEMYSREGNQFLFADNDGSEEEDFDAHLSQSGNGFIFSAS